MFVTLIEEYMKHPQDVRKGHLDLTESCIEIGGKSVQFRGLLAHYLGTTIPSGNGIHLCHACNNENCSNPRHLYWGTASENLIDQHRAGSRPKHLTEAHKKALSEAMKKISGR